VRRDITVAAELRDSRGKNEARRLRAAGSMPAVLYGGPDGAKPVAVSPKELTKILNSKTGHNTIFNLGVNGDSTPVMIIDWQYDPIKDRLLHVDLKRIDLSKRITVKVPVLTQGDPKGVKLQGGIQDVVTREIEIECLPEEIPEQFVINVSDLMIGQSIRAVDVPLGGSMKLLTLPETVITHVISIKAEETTTAETGGAAPTAAAEPEVIKKGKKEEEGAEATPKKK
jgi:large subunit ribosomal protein L25